MHPAIAAVLQYFEYEHLPEGPLRNTSKKFHDLAHDIANDETLSGPMVTNALNRLLESKDCAVRAAL